MGLDILLVEDEPTLLLTLGDALCEAGHRVTRCTTGAQAASRLGRGSFDLLVADIRLPGQSGCELAELALKRRPPTPVILMTAYAEVQQAVAMMRRGVRDYLTKPFAEEELLARVAEIERANPGRDKPTLEPIAASPQMAEVLRTVRHFGPTHATVLLSGETGAGKEVVARYLHACSNRADKPFVALNCASIPAELAESELFGHVRGAFTGAASSRQGTLRAADGGTLLLDEIGELSAAIQAKLLRTLETREVLPVGSDKPVTVDVRLIAATNRDLEEEARAGRFRRDLWFRLNAVEIRVPPLRERMEDLVPLFLHFLAVAAPGATGPTGIAENTVATLASYSWPGNVRELKNAAEHAAVLCGQEVIRPSHLPPRILGEVASEKPLALRATLERVEESELRRALALSGGHRQHAADLLGISRKHLWELSRRYGIIPSNE